MQSEILGFGNPVLHGGWKVWLCLPLLWARCPEQAHPYRITFWKEEVMSHEIPGCDGWCEMYYSKTLRLEEEKGYEASKLICPLDYFILVSSLSFSVPINLKLEACHTWWQKNQNSRVTLFTSLKVRTLVWSIQITVTGRNWTTIICVLHTCKPLYWKKYGSV